MNSVSLLLAVIVLGCIQLFQTIVTVGLLRRYRTLQRAVKNAGVIASALPTGTPTATFKLPDIRSNEESEVAPRPNRGQVLLFLSSGCSFCIDVAQQLSRTASAIRSNYVPICIGIDEECKLMAKYLPAELPLLVDEDRGIARRYGVSTFPTAVVLSPSLIVQGYAHPLSHDDLAELVQAPSFTAGDGAPDAYTSDIPLPHAVGDLRMEG